MEITQEKAIEIRERLGAVQRGFNNVLTATDNNVVERVKAFVGSINALSVGVDEVDDEPDLDEDSKEQ
jgi:hypothetical protein